MKLKNALWILTLFILIQSVSAADAPKVYQMVLNYDGGEVTKESMEIVYGYLPDQIDLPESGYLVELINVMDETIYEYKFNFVTDFSITKNWSECLNDDESYNETKCNEYPGFLQLTQTLEIINVPYSSIGKEIRLYNPDNELILTIDVTEYSDYCGDGICSERESNLICAIDCETEEFFIIEEEKGYGTYLITGLVLLLLLGFFGLISRKKTGATEI